MREFVTRVMRRLSFTECRDEDCWARKGYHSAHLTRIGRYRYIGRFQ